VRDLVEVGATLRSHAQASAIRDPEVHRLAGKHVRGGREADANDRETSRRRKTRRAAARRCAMHTDE